MIITSLPPSPEAVGWMLFGFAVCCALGVISLRAEIKENRRALLVWARR